MRPVWGVQGSLFSLLVNASLVVMQPAFISKGRYADGINAKKTASYRLARSLYSLMY